MRLLATVCVLVIGAGCNDAPAPFSSSRFGWADSPFATYYNEGGASAAAITLPASPLHHYDASVDCAAAGANVALASWSDVGTGADPVTATGTPTCRNDNGPWEVDFNGTGDYFTAIDAAFDDLAQPFTACYGVRHDDAIGINFEVAFDDENASGGRTQMSRASSGSATPNGAGLFAGTAVEFSVVQLNDAAYHRVCALVNGAASYFNIDGSAEAVISPGGNGLDDITIGARGSTRTVKLKGRLTDVWLKAGDHMADIDAWAGDV